jgi:periplasmic divalent cation tolerance protein
MTDAVLCQITCASLEEALRIAEALVEERLAACANILPGVRSIYRWQGRVERAEEVELTLKTRRPLVPELTRRVQALHSYECPCIIALPIEGGNAAYLDWIKSETS